MRFVQSQGKKLDAISPQYLCNLGACWGENLQFPNKTAGATIILQKKNAQGGWDDFPLQRRNINESGNPHIFRAKESAT